MLWGQSPLLTPGEYRQGENRVVDATGGPVFTTPPSGDVPERMAHLGRWLATGASGHPAPVVAAVAHLELVAIHPLNGGNGRTARALTRLILSDGGYALDGLVSVDAQLDLDRTAYLGAIRDAVGRDHAPGYDATPFVGYLVASMASAADHALGRLRPLAEVTTSVRRTVRDGSLPASMIDGLADAWVNRHLLARPPPRPTDRARLLGDLTARTTQPVRSALSLQPS